MKFQQIKEDSHVAPGEYLLHQPSDQIVMCGSFKREEGLIKALASGRLLEDKIENFRKILVSGRRRQRLRRGCGGCKKS